MPDKRKSRGFSLIMFYSLSFIAVVICAMITIDGARYTANRQSDYNYDSAVVQAQREIDRLKNSVKDPADTLPAPGKNITVTGNEYHPAEIRDSLFSFQITYDSVKVDDYWYHKIKSITVFRIADQQKIQTIIPKEPFDVPPYQTAFEVEDMNFDGYNDFRAMSMFMTRGQTFYDFWLYDPAKGKFKADTFLSNNMWDVAFDHKAKTVTSNQRLAGGPFEGVNEVYCWENGKLVLQHREECHQNPFGGEDGDLTMTKRIDGKLVSRSKHYDTIPFTPTGTVIFEWDKLK